MGNQRNFFNSASPTSKMFMAIAATTGFVVVYKYFYAPYVRKQRYRRAEAWADKILDQEETENTVPQYEQH